MTDTLTVDDRVITIDYNTPFVDMIAAGNYEWTNADITAYRFPVTDCGNKTFRIKLFHLDRDISSEDALAAVKEDGFEPATHVHGLAFGAAYPDEQRKYPIVCLGSSAQVDGLRRVVYLGGNDAGRSLDLSRWDGDWGGGLYRFLGVQEVSAT